MKSLFKLAIKTPERHLRDSGVFIGPPAVTERVIMNWAYPSVRPSARLSFFPLIFLGLVHFFFLKLCMVLGSHMEMCMTEPNFRGKILFQQNWPIMVKKWPKNGFFGLFRKIYSLVLSVNDVEWNYFWPFSILQKLHMWEKPAISCIIFWDFLMFYQIFLSPQIKWWAIITYKHGIFELPHELLDDLRLRILGN